MGKKQVLSASYFLLLLKMLSSFETIHMTFFITCNMKLANIICSIQYQSSKYSCCCCWCDANSVELKDQGTPRNFRSFRMQYKAFIEKEKGNMMRTKDFLNVVHNPSLDQEDVKQVIEFIP